AERYRSAPAGAAPTAPRPFHIQQPKPSIAAREDLANQPTPAVVVLASAQGLEPKGRASLVQHLKNLKVPAGRPAELNIALTVVRGKVGKVQVVKAAGAADPATVKAVAAALEAWQAP